MMAPNSEYARGVVALGFDRHWCAFFFVERFARMIIRSNIQ